MKYLSIDIESTGLNPEKHQILSIGVVVEDTNDLNPIEELPTFHCAVLHNEIKGQPYALNMNRELISKIVEYQTSKDKNAVEDKYNMLFRKEEDVVKSLWEFLIENDFMDINVLEQPYVELKDGKMFPMITNKTPVTHVTVAGKNFGTFDKLFIENLPRWKQLFKIRQRIIDPAVLFVDWKNHESLPNLSTCKQIAGFEKNVTHNADEDAKDIIRLLRKHYD